MIRASLRAITLTTVLAAIPAPAARAQGLVVPEAAALERLNLRAEWSAAVPLEGGRDAYATVQVADEAQIFVQTQSGLIVALDAATGARQWSYRYPSSYVAVYPVGWTEEYVYAANLTHLLCFRRSTGVLVFDVEVPGSAAAGPVADRSAVYVNLNGGRIAAYVTPQAVAARPTRSGLNAAEVVAQRYTNGLAGGRELQFDRTRVPEVLSSDVGLGNGQRSPSISSLPSVTPPYTLSTRGLFDTPSVSTLPSMRQPFQLYPDYLRAAQRTPSIAVLNSIARAAELSRPALPGPKLEPSWTHATGKRYSRNLLLTDRDAPEGTDNDEKFRRLWLTTDGPDVEAVTRAAAITASGALSRQPLTVVEGRLPGTPATPLAGPLALAPDRVYGAVGLTDGSVVLIDLLRGTDLGPQVEWRTNVGGLPNFAPVLTRDSVYSHGSQSGVCRIDLVSGAVLWRTDDSAERVLAVNDEYVYVRDRRGDLLVYDKSGAQGQSGGRLTPLARLNLAGFNVPVTNTRTDRLVVASPSGLIVSLRDRSPKYARPMRIVPKTPAVAPKDVDRNAPDLRDAAPAAPAPAPAPKNEPEPKKDDAMPKKKGGEKI